LETVAIKSSSLALDEILAGTGGRCGCRAHEINFSSRREAPAPGSLPRSDSHASSSIGRSFDNERQFARELEWRLSAMFWRFFSMLAPFVSAVRRRDFWSQ
jgi:hypothetical protein